MAITAVEALVEIRQARQLLAPHPEGMTIVQLDAYRQRIEEILLEVEPSLPMYARGSKT